MTKEHKKLYKAGKNWIVATLTATTITLLGGIGACTVQADTTTEGNQNIQVTSVSQQSLGDNSDNSVSLKQPVTPQSNQSAQENQVSQNDITTTPAVTTASDSDKLDSSIYGTVNIKDWDYQENNHILRLTNYHASWNSLTK